MSDRTTAPTTEKTRAIWRGIAEGNHSLENMQLSELFILRLLDDLAERDAEIGRLTGAARDLGITYRRFAPDSRIDDILARVDDPHDVLDEYIRELASENRRLTDTDPGEGGCFEVT